MLFAKLTFGTPYLSTHIEFIENKKPLRKIII